MLIAKAGFVHQESSNSQYVGELGKRQEFTLTLDKIVPIEMGYAVALYCWHDPDSNQLVWFASRNCLEYEEGQEYRIKATVKRHQERYGVKQTVINRLKMIQLICKPLNVDELSDDEKTVEGAWAML